MTSLLTLLFITFKWVDALDVILVAFLIYQLYNLVKGTPAVSIFSGIFSIYIVWMLVRALDMKLFGSILGKFIDVGVIAIIIVFQQEIRRFLLFIGTNEFLSRRKILKNFFRLSGRSNKDKRLEVKLEPIINACFEMGKTHTGALIVIARSSDLKLYINTGEAVDAIASERVLENIFFKNSPLHDGAVIIAGERILAARCVLPVTEKEQFPAHFGMRHRAAVGITEHTDAVALSVSEQTGKVSVCISGDLKTGLSREKLSELLQREFNF